MKFETNVRRNHMASRSPRGRLVRVAHAFAACGDELFVGFLCHNEDVYTPLDATPYVSMRCRWPPNRAITALIWETGDGKRTPGGVFRGTLPTNFEIDNNDHSPPRAGGLLFFKEMRIELSSR